MKTYLLGLLAALVVLAAGERAYRVYQWKHYTDRRAFYAEVAGAYLFGASGVVNDRGEPLTRQQILDAYMHLQIEAHPEWKLRFTNK